MRAVLLCVLLLSAATRAWAATPLVINAALDRNVVAPLLDAFSRANPDIALIYHDSSTLEVERQLHSATPADIVLSSAMPWQLAAVNANRARPLDIPEAAEWPGWAKWRNEVFGFTFEPIVIAYRLELAHAMRPPETHRDVLALLHEHRELLRGRVTAYSPERSGVGYTLFQQDARYSPRFWDLVAALGAADVSLEASSREMLEGMSAGRYWLGYNLLGSYALVWAREHPDIIVQVPSDYSLVLMRMAFVTRDAPHPEAARRFMAFLLGREGQHVLAGQTPLFSVHPDVTGPYTAQRLRDQVGDHLYPIPIDASLLAFVDPLRRDAFMARWQREMAILDDDATQ